MVPKKCQAINCTNVDLLPTGSYKQTSVKFDVKYKHFYLKQIPENVVGKMGAILFRQ